MVVLVGVGFLSGIMFKVEGDNPELAKRLNIDGAVLLPSTFLLVSLYQMIPPMVKRSRKEKAERELANERGSMEEWKVWKIVRAKEYCQKIYALDREHWDSTVRQQHEARRKVMTIEEEQKMIRVASERGIIKLFIDHKSCAMTWTEYEEISREQAGGLATCEELKSSGANAGDGIDFWNPIIRDDGREGDYCQMGNHETRPDRYFSHFDGFGFLRKDPGVRAQLWGPTEFIWCRASSTSKTTMIGDDVKVDDAIIEKRFPL